MCITSVCAVCAGRKVLTALKNCDACYRQHVWMARGKANVTIAHPPPSTWTTCLGLIDGLFGT